MNSQDRYAVEYAGDVVELLTDQHEQLKLLMTRVLAVSGPQRKQLFDEVRDTLARHEAAEEAVVRPLTRSAPGGDQQAAEPDERGAEREGLSPVRGLRHGQPRLRGRVPGAPGGGAPARGGGGDPGVPAAATHARRGDPAGGPGGGRTRRGGRPGRPPGHGTFAALLDRARALFSRS